jgi:hypothetical protein
MSLLAHRVSLPSMPSSPMMPKGVFAPLSTLCAKQCRFKPTATWGLIPLRGKAVAANARLATLGGGEYLHSRLDPATPHELADAVRSFATNHQESGMNQLVGMPNTDPTVAALLNEAQAASTRITDLCK